MNCFSFTEIRIYLHISSSDLEFYVPSGFRTASDDCKAALIYYKASYKGKDVECSTPPVCKRHRH